MSFAQTEYLSWVMRHHGRVGYNLLASGMKPVPLAELGMPASLDDFATWGILRSKIARFGGVPESEALATLGTTHGLWAAYSALLSPGDDALVEAPSYEPMWRIAEGVGARVIRFERAESKRWALDPDAVGRAMTERTRVVAITNVSNPFGVRASDDVVRAIARIAESRGAKLLVDEVYAPFDALASSDGTWQDTARHLAPNVVTVASLTKGYGVGDHRIGWVLGPEDVVARAENAIVSNMGHTPLTWASFASHAFDRILQLADRARKNIEGKRARVTAWVESREDLSWSAPSEGLFGFAIDKSGRDLTDVLERGIHEHDVIVGKGTFFGVPHGFRLAWSIDRELLDEALLRLGRVLDAR